ncbi:exodeoxyribonuclease VII large subunit [Clostridium swellfunianum]|uniref:exodeoxyribonuclease VII large subunit n=1 Tax=Clostridium swellfunianum TaxID=1367462 RepID=UPI00202E4591|nr:exodeoxyribonuclease VII large subunit [Clostridium swellfunianum]MCM0650368.1 exodeoxyribonuclease VII large subunit [Clostridium swellfunianum]
MYIKTLSVSALNNYVKKMIDADFILNNLNIKGEISNFKMHSSGHLYFSLKDENSKINCIMFKTYASNLKFRPKDGESVVVKGKVSVYEKDGAYQLYCYEMKQEGIGELYIKFQEMKNKLEREGLFNLEHKRAIPKYPARIGIITSPTGAAVRDIINVATRRNKAVDLLLYPALVQGENASEDIIRGLKILNNTEKVDVIILARGGGSIEELWAFNNEKLAYEVFNSKKPIITGVGHETDFTIVDFVSDMRAPTPSAAAELAVPGLEEIQVKIEGYSGYFEGALKDTLRRNHNKVELLKKTLEIHSPMNKIINQYNYIDNLQSRLAMRVESKLRIKREELSRLHAVIDAHNPLKVLNKGYAVIEDANGKLVSSKQTLLSITDILITVKDGRVKAALEYVEEK